MGFLGLSSRAKSCLSRRGELRGAKKRVIFFKHHVGCAGKMENSRITVGGGVKDFTVKKIIPILGTHQCQRVWLGVIATNKGINPNCQLKTLHMIMCDKNVWMDGYCIC